MAYFDTTLEAPPIAEQQTTPIIPEDRFIFELVGFERADPDQWNKDGSVRWTFRVYDQDGRVFEFRDEPYDFYRKTGLIKVKDAQGNVSFKPNFNVGTMANDWASALLGRDLGTDANFSVSELRNKRMQAMVVWERQKQDKTKWSVKLASLRHVPVGGAPAASAAAPAAAHEDALGDDVERSVLVTDMEKYVKRLKKLDAEKGTEAAKAFAESDLEDAPLDDLRRLLKSFQDAVMAAMDA